MPPLLLQIRDALSVFTLPPFLDRLFGPPPYTASATTATSKVTVAATPTGATLSEMTVVASQSPLPCRSPWSFLSLYTPLALYPLENEAITKTQTGSSFRRRSLATVSYPTPSSSSDAVCYSSSLSHGSSISPGEPSLSSYASSTSTEPIGRATLPPSGPTPQHCNFLPSPPASPPQTLVQTREARAESSVHSPQPQPSQVPKSQTYHHQLQPQPGGHYHQRQQQPLPCYTNDLGPRANKTKWNKNGHTNERVLKFLAYVEDIETIPEDVKYWHDDTHFIIKDRFPKAIEHYLVMPRERLEKLHQLSGAHGVETIERLQKRGEWLIDILQKEKPYLKFTMGFHVIPSMLQIHLHVISLDFHSKHNRWPPHYNSFTTAFFIHPNDLITTLNERGHFWLSVPELQWYREQKKAPLQCNQCVFLAQNMKGLKLHLEDHVRAMMAPEQ